MRPITTTATDSSLNRNVLNVLNVLSDRLNLFVFSFGECGELVSFSTQRVVHLHLWVFELTHPRGNFTPVCECLDGHRWTSCRWVVTHSEMRGEIPIIRTQRFVQD